MQKLSLSYRYGSSIGCLVVVAASLIVTQARAGTAYNTEAVDLYESSYGSCWGPGSDLPGSVADADGFRNQMDWNPSWLGITHGGFTPGQRWVNQAVYTGDFYDPDRTLSPAYDQDQVYFDVAGTAISYFAGHGANVFGDTSQSCTSASSCVSPPPGATFPAICKRVPGDTTTGSCDYTWMWRALLVGNCASGIPRGGQVIYGSNAAKWGENSWPANWAGAGTIGGTNVVHLHMSHPHATARAQELFPLYAGVMMIASPLIHSGGDSYIHQDLGNYWAVQAMNPNSSVAAGYLAASASIGTSGAYPCTNRSGTVNYGGGHGVHNCGGAVVGSLDSTVSYAQSNLARSWYNIQNDAYKAYGTGYYWEYVSCNYNCNQWPFTF